MRYKIVVPIGLTITLALLSVEVTTAQQRGGAGGAVAAPSRAVPATAPTMGHAPIRVVTPAAPARTAGHASVPAVHLVVPRIPAHPVSPKPPAHNRPGHQNSASTNGHYFTPTPAVEDDNGIPGLGFDYPHYAATHPNAGRHHPHDGSVFPFIGGGYYIPTMSYAEAGVPAETGSEGQQAETEDLAAETAEPTPVEQPAVVPQPHPNANAKVAPSAEYIFVRRDGTVFFAVAYSWLNGNLQYVTQDGYRRLVPTTTLDLDATTQFNEQRGVAFHSPA